MSLRKLVFAAGVIAMSAGFAAPAAAHDHWRHGHGHHGPRSSFEFNIDVWRGGYWDRNWRDGRYGWYWTVGPRYYYYPAPVYPYPDPYTPPVVVVQPPAAPPQATGAPPPQYWYYCDDPEGYYPYVSACREQWRPVPVTPPGK